MNLSKIHHIAIIVSDYEAAKDFYVNKLGFSVIRENYRPEREDWKLDLRVNEQKTLNDKDLPVKESIQMVMESGDNETGSITLKMNLTYHNPGKSVTVTLPDDLNTYQEISN